MKKCFRYSGALMACGVVLSAGLGQTLAAVPKMDAGTIQVAQTSRGQWHAVTFASPFLQPPVVVMGPLSANDSQPATLRVRNVTTAGMEFKIDEWNYLDGVHATETVTFMAIDAGRHTVGGLTIDARRLDVGGSFQTVNFSTPFGSTPVVLSQVETTRNLAGSATRALTTRLSNVGASAFSIRLQAEEAYKSSLLVESTSVMAISAGTGTVGGFRLQAGLTASVVNQGWSQIAFSESFNSPGFLAHLQTFNTTKPVEMRLRGLAATTVDVKAEPELSASKKPAVSKEVAGFLVFRTVVLDSDGDGLPDDWELAYGLNPNNPADAAQDPDGDGYTSLEEFQRGSNPVVFTEGQNGGTISIEVITRDAFEKESKSARFRVVRTGSVEPVLVSFAVSGNPDLTKGSASVSDYVLRDTLGATLTGTIRLPLNATEAEIVVQPVVDTIDEVPEALVVSLSPRSNYTLGLTTLETVFIRDAENTLQNQRLFVAYLAPQGSAATLASGLATVRLQGDNTSGLVTLMFGGLTSPQTAVHIHIANPVSGPDIESLPLGQVSDHLWNIRAVQFLATDQEALNALFAGRIYINVHSANYPTGEIRGDYHLQTGSTELQVPPPPPPIAPLAGEALDRDIARFLAQATFGPTRELVTEVRQMILDPVFGGDRIAGMSAWLDRQMDPQVTPPISLYEYVRAADAQEWALYLDANAPYYNPTFEPSLNNRRRGWWTQAVKGSDHLRQRVQFALSEIFVVSERDSEVANRHYGLANYYDMLGRNAFGSYRTLLEDVSLHPIMGRYLSHLKNQKQVVDSQGKVVVSPDENYAREVMQLLSIGLVDLHLDGSIRLGAEGLPIATYDQNDIVEMARVLTGWSFSKRNNGSTDEVIDNTSFNLGNGLRYYQAQWMYPMKMFPAYHDTGAKTIVGGWVIPAGQTGEQDLGVALDTLAAHHNTAPFIALRLIQRLVTSNPSRGYLYRVAKTFEDSGGDLGQVIKAILLDYEARSPELVVNFGFGKQREPVVRYVATLRALGAASKLPLSDLTVYGYPAGELAKYPAGTTRYRYGNTESDLSQSPLRSPTVFNWFRPDYSPAGSINSAGLVAPEFQLTTETQVIRAINYQYQVTFVSTGQSVSSLPNQAAANDDNVILDLLPAQQIYDTAIAGGASVTAAVTQCVDYLDLLLTSGNLKARYESALAPNPRSIIISTSAAAATSSRVKTALYLLATSPEFVVQK